MLRTKPAKQEKPSYPSCNVAIIIVPADSAEYKAIVRILQGQTQPPVIVAS